MTISTPIGQAIHIVQRAAESDSMRATHDAPSAAVPGSASTEDHPPPQREQLQPAACDRRQPEELRATMRAEVVVHRRSRRSAPRRARTDASSRRRSPRSSTSAGRSVKRWRRNIRKSQSVSRTLQAEQQLDDVVVHAADHLAVPRVAPADLVALDDVDVARWRAARSTAASRASYCASPSV